MKRQLLSIFALFLFFLTFFMFIKASIHEKTLRSILKVNFDDINRIEFLNDRTGEKVTVDNILKIKELMGLVDTYIVRQIKGSPQIKPGTAYSAQFIIGDSRIFSLQFPSENLSTTLGINGEEYVVINTRLSIKEIEKLFD